MCYTVHVHCVVSDTLWSLVALAVLWSVVGNKQAYGLCVVLLGCMVLSVTRYKALMLWLFCDQWWGTNKPMDYVLYCCCCWSLLYSAIIRSWADSLHSHVILHEWLAVYNVFLNIHGRKWCTYSASMADATWNCCHLSMFCVHHANHAPHHFMQCHILEVHAYLAVTCHMHFWQNDQDPLHATAVARGWNRYQNKSQHRKLTLENKIIQPLQQGFEPMKLLSWVRRSNHWAIHTTAGVHCAVVMLYCHDCCSGKLCNYTKGPASSLWTAQWPLSGLCAAVLPWCSLAFLTHCVAMTWYAVLAHCSNPTVTSQWWGGGGRETSGLCPNALCFPDSLGCCDTV